MNVSPHSQAHEPGLSTPRAAFRPTVTETPVMVTTTDVLTSASAFEGLRGEWDGLLDDSDQQVFFLRWKWNQAWWQHFAPPGSRLRLIVCRDAERRLVGIAPLYLLRRRYFGITYFRELVLVGMGVELKTSEHLDVIARRGAERAVAQAVAECLLGNREWDRLRLWQVPRESAVLPHLARALGAGTRVSVCDRAPYIDTSTDWATFKAGFGRSMRRNVEYYSRRLFKRYPGCEFSRVRSAAELEPAMDALVRLHQARWRAMGEPGAFSYGLDVFLHDVSREMFDRSRVVVWTLKIGGRIEAALLGFLDNGVLHYFQKGFNPAYTEDDLGTAMLGLCVRDCFDDPAIRAFDFMGGGAPYKDLWAKRSRENVVLDLQRPTRRTALFAAGTRLLDRISETYRRVVPDAIRAARRERLRKRRLDATTHLAPLLVLLVDYLLVCESLLA